MQLNQETAEQLAFDVGAEYFSDQQLCLRYNLTLGQLNNIRAQPAFQKELDEVKRILNDGGDKFVYEARKASMSALKTLATIHENEENTPSLRARAASDIIEIAGVKKVQAPGEGQKIIINTNLAIGSEQKGTYTVISKAAHPEAAPAQIMATQRLAKLPRAAMRRRDGLDLVEDTGEDLV